MGDLRVKKDEIVNKRKVKPKRYRSKKKQSIKEMFLTKTQSICPTV